MKVLVDLKPALDGYAGIPQESRLLFKGLSQIESFDVEGLIQHGGRRLRPALSGHKTLSPDKRIDRLSKFVVSLFEKPYDNLFQEILGQVQKSFARQILRLRAYLGWGLPMSRFESDLFEDFMWRTFFSKTLNASAKPVLKGSRHRVLSVSRKLMHQAGLDGLKYSDSPSYARVNTTGFDCFVTQTPFPGHVSRGTQMVVRYHDAVPVLMPHTISDKAFHQASHFHALKDNVNHGAWFSCISHATRADLLQLFPQAESRSVVIHNIVSDEYFVEDTPAHLVHQIIRNRLAVSDEVKSKLPKAMQAENQGQKQAAPLRYLLMVSTIEPRKNHLLLMQAWEALKYHSHPDLKLVIVGNIGWDQVPVLESFRPWAARGDLFWLTNVPAAELRALYHHAAATVCPGLAEGFDYSGVEAMKCGCVVAASDIPVHREIYGEAAVYFDPYDAADATAQFTRLIDSDAQSLRADLVEQGLAVGQLYTENVIMPQWVAFFSRLRAQALQS